MSVCGGAQVVFAENCIYELKLPLTITFGVIKKT